MSSQVKTGQVKTGEGVIGSDKSVAKPGSRVWRKSGVPSQKYSGNADDGSRAARPFKSRAGRLGSFAEVARAEVTHTNDSRWIPDARGARDVAGFFTVRSGQRGACFGNRVTGKEQVDTAPVDVAARTHTLHDFLACVAALDVADVAVLEARFVRNLFFAKVVAEPWSALREPLRAQRRVTCGATAMLAHRFKQGQPERG